MMKFGRKTIAVIIALSLTFASFLQPRAPVWANVDKSETKYFKPGIWQTLDNLENLSSNPEDWIESGNYCYEFLDSQKKYITIRDFWGTVSSDGILTIPEKIDGYKVLGVGTWPAKVGALPEDQKHIWSWGREKIVMQENPLIRKIVLPEGLEFLGGDSFRNCYNMKEIYLPDSLVAIADGALSCATDLEKIEFPQGVYVDKAAFGGPYSGNGCSLSLGGAHPLKMVLYSNCHIAFDTDSYIAFPKGKKTELEIRYCEGKNYYYALQGYITKLCVDKKLSEFQLEMGLGVCDTDNPPLLDYYVTKLIMNGKNTKLKLSKYVNDVFPNGGLKGLYTVEGAASIKEVKKYNVPSYWKTTGKAREIKGKKMDSTEKKGMYQAGWRKIKTNICKYWYNLSKGKWTSKKTPAQTVYKVYGKKKKSDSYQLIKTTKKRSIQSKYKYIKVVPVKEWE